jgi:hypothetical protein
VVTLLKFLIRKAGCDACFPTLLFLPASGKVFTLHVGLDFPAAL